MAYFRNLTNQLVKLQSLFSQNDTWLILINADPDALGSAMALARIMRNKVKRVEIARVNEITRPDNLAMIRYLRIPVKAWNPARVGKYDKFAILDSQPHHHPAFAGIDFSIIIDHHPLPEDGGAPAPFKEIRPDYGSACTMLLELLYNAKIRPAKLLASAMQYGIRTDTGMFTRNATELDLRAYHYLSKYSDTNLLFRIIRSEYLPEWLPYFSRAFNNLRRCGHGHLTYLEEVSSPDILVVIADFFLKVHGLRYIAVAGVSKGVVTVIFRGHGKDLNALAQAAFGDIGTAGGHKNMARAEFSTEALLDNHELAECFARRPGRKSKAVCVRGYALLESYLLNRLKNSTKRAKKAM